MKRFKITLYISPQRFKYLLPLYDGGAVGRSPCLGYAVINITINRTIYTAPDGPALFVHDDRGGLVVRSGPLSFVYDLACELPTDCRSSRRAALVGPPSVADETTTPPAATDGADTEGTTAAPIAGGASTGTATRTNTRTNSAPRKVAPLLIMERTAGTTTASATKDAHTKAATAHAATISAATVAPVLADELSETKCAIFSRFKALNIVGLISCPFFFIGCLAGLVLAFFGMVSRRFVIVPMHTATAPDVTYTGIVPRNMYKVFTSHVTPCKMYHFSPRKPLFSGKNPMKWPNFDPYPVGCRGRGRGQGGPPPLYGRMGALWRFSKITGFFLKTGRAFFKTILEQGTPFEKPLSKIIFMRPMVCVWNH